MVRWLVLACIFLLTLYPTITRIKILDEHHYRGRNQMQMMRSAVMRRLYEQRYQVSSISPDGRDVGLDEDEIRKAFLFNTEIRKTREVRGGSRSNEESLVDHSGVADEESTDKGAADAADNRGKGFPSDTERNISISSLYRSPPSEGDFQDKSATRSSEFERTADSDIAPTEEEKPEKIPMAPLNDYDTAFESHAADPTRDDEFPTVLYKKKQPSRTSSTSDKVEVPGAGYRLSLQASPTSALEGVSLEFKTEAEVGTGHHEHPDKGDPLSRDDINDFNERTDPPHGSLGQDTAHSDARLTLSEDEASERTSRFLGEDSKHQTSDQESNVKGRGQIHQTFLNDVMIPESSTVGISREDRIPVDEPNSSFSADEFGPSDKINDPMHYPSPDEELNTSKTTSEDHMNKVSSPKSSTDTAPIGTSDNQFNGELSEDKESDHFSDAAAGFSNRLPQAESDLIDFDALDEINQLLSIARSTTQSMSAASKTDMPPWDIAAILEEEADGVQTNVDFVEVDDLGDGRHNDDASEPSEASKKDRTERSMKEDDMTRPAVKEVESPAKKAAPKEGSLASFFQKVTERESVLLGTKAVANPKEDDSFIEDSKATRKVSASSVTSDDELSEPEEINNVTFSELSDESGAGHKGTWGVKRSVKEDGIVASLIVDTHGPPSVPDEEIPAKNETVTIEATDHEARKDNPGTIDGSPRPKSVNTEFVEGLDDIDKFLEKVDPPDELDVGAAGSSIQEVLFGQGTQIAMKRIAIGLRHARARVKRRLDRFMSRRRKSHGAFASISRQQFQSVAARVRQVSERALNDTRDRIADLFGFGDVDESEFSFDQEEFGLEEMRQRLKRQRPIDTTMLRPSDGELDAFIRRRTPPT